MIITDIGHLEVFAAGRAFALIPSFQAMTRIGSPEQIVATMAGVFGSYYPKHRITNHTLAREVIRRAYAETTSAAARVVQACCDDDMREVLGEITVTARGTLRRCAGLMPLDDIHIIAQHLLLHGVIGDQPPEGGEEKGGYSPRFEARSWVYLAMAHLGISETEAWGMTMTGLRAALAAKYPQKEKPKIPTEQEYDEFMEMADALMVADSGVQSL